MSDKNRWRLYRRWMFDARETCSEYISDFRQLYDDQVLRLKEVRKQEECEILKKAHVIGMTTTGERRFIEKPTLLSNRILEFSCILIYKSQPLKVLCLTKFSGKMAVGFRT